MSYTIPYFPLTYHTNNSSCWERVSVDKEISTQHREGRCVEGKVSYWIMGLATWSNIGENMFVEWPSDNRSFHYPHKNDETHLIVKLYLR